MHAAFLAIFSFLLAVPDLQLVIDRVQNSITVNLQGKDPLFEHCIKSGFVLRYNFESQICKKNRFWFDDCPRKRRIKYQLTYNSITNQYKMEADRIGDDQPALVTYYNSLNEAQRAFFVVEDLSMHFIAHEDTSYLEDPQSYLRARAFSDCLGDYNRTVGSISNFLTFGLYRMSGFDTGWIDFEFKHVKSADKE